MLSFALRRLPIFIALLFAVDFALGVVPVVDYWAGSPFPRLTNLFNLDTEGTLPTWYSSAQWLCAGALFSLFTIYASRYRLRGMLCAAALSLTCVAFSADEVAQIHERLGSMSDVLMSGGSRHGTALWSTGLWPFLIGLPVLVSLGAAVRGMRHIFAPRAPRAQRLLITGLAIMFTGALAIELAANVVDNAVGQRGWALTQVVAEEFLEMLGVSFIVWSAYALLQAYGFAVKLPERSPTQLMSAIADSTGAGAPAASRTPELNRAAAPFVAACASTRSVDSCT